LEDDLSQLSFDEFMDGMKVVARESFRVLKPGKVCAILIGDTRKYKHYIPIALRVMETFLDCGFVLKRRYYKDTMEYERHTRELE